MVLRQYSLSYFTICGVGLKDVHVIVSSHKSYISLGTGVSCLTLCAFVVAIKSCHLMLSLY